MEAPQRRRSISTTPQKHQTSDYEREFKTFFTPSYTRLAPPNRYSKVKNDSAHVRRTVDEGMEFNLEVPALVKSDGKPTSKDLSQLFPKKILRYPPQAYSVRDIMKEVDGTTSHPIDLTGQHSRESVKSPLHLLAKVPMKSLKFAEDVRPPYIGTYTRLRDARSISHLARNPCKRGLPDTNYDYDSEAEWEEPVEGEDLVSEGEEEADDDDDGDEMAGFLDDEGSTDAARTVRRRPVLGNQEPVCSGIYWETPEGVLSHHTLTAQDWRHLKLDVLMGKSKFS